MNGILLKTSRRRYLTLGISATFAVALCGAAYAASSAGWSLNGRYVSSNVRMIGGQAYVPLADIARAMNLKVTKKGSTYAVQASAGGATQVNGLRQGEIGDQLSSGKWGFLVTGVQEMAEYSERYSQEGRQIVAKPGEKLVVIDAWIRNNVQKTQTPILTERYCGNTALTDDQGQSYVPIDIDARQKTNKSRGYGAATLLPAAKMKMALVFSVPQETKVKSLVFSALGFPENVGRKGVDLRIALLK